MTASTFSEAEARTGWPGLLDLVKSFPGQARLALGTRGVLWATVAGLVGIACCVVAFADIALSLHRSDVDPQRRRARDVLELDLASRNLMRHILANSAANPGPARVRVSGEPLQGFLHSLGKLCDEFEPAVQSKLGAACREMGAFAEWVSAEVARFDETRQPLRPALLRELLDVRDEISDLSQVTTRTADAIIGRLVDDYAASLLVLTVCTTGFAASGLMLILLVGRTAMNFHAQWHAALDAGRDAAQNRDMLREIIEALPAGVVVYDKDERLMMFNSVAQSITPALNEPGVIGQTYEMLARDSARRLEAAGLGPQPVEGWIERFRTKSVERMRQAGDGRWFNWFEKRTASGMTVGLRVDVSEIKNQELQTEQARARFQSLVESMADMVYTIDGKGHFTYVSPSAAVLLGVPSQAMIGTRFRDWVATDDVDLVMAASRAFHLAPNREQRQIRFRLRAADGSLRPVEVRYRQPVGEDSTAAQVGVIRDVTELERARAEYQNLVDSLADVAYRLDVETGRFTFMSAAAREVFGASPEQMVGRHFMDFIAPDSRERVQRTTTRAYDPSDQGTFARFTMLGQGGEPRHVEVRARRRLDEHGRLVSIGIIRDVEERVRLETRLDQEVSRLRSIVESGGALIVLVDGQLNVTMVNSGFTQITGIAETDAVGRQLAEIMSFPLDPGRTRRSRFAVKMTDRIGRDRLFAVTATPVTDVSGAVTSIVLLGVDDTERREAEQALYNAERFATVGEMAGTMAHEISQPLQVINIACTAAREELGEAASRGAAAEATDFVQEKLERIANQVDTASRIIGDLRAYVRGTTSGTPEPFDVNEAVRSAVDLTDHGVREAGLILAERLTDGVPPVMGDAARLEQVMVNLINNARDAGGKTIIVTTGTFAETNRNGGERRFVRIMVEDTGHGIAPEILPKLFHAFVSTKPRGKGTGLGLRICRRILEEMGGRISASNRDEGGARFEILLPVHGA